MYTFTVTMAVLIACVAAYPRDVTWDTKVGKGKVFGTLGNDESSLYGKGGYKQEIFNDDRGKLTGEAYASRVLGQSGDSSHLGGRMDFANDNAKAAVDISRQIGGRTSLDASGSGVWKIDKDTDFSAGAMIRQQRLGHGRPDYGVRHSTSIDFREKTTNIIF